LEGVDAEHLGDPWVLARPILEADQTAGVGQPGEAPDSQRCGVIELLMIDGTPVLKIEEGEFISAPTAAADRDRQTATIGRHELS
jgi:hypothetical protein